MAGASVRRAGLSPPTVTSRPMPPQPTATSSPTPPRAATRILSRGRWSAREACRHTRHHPGRCLALLPRILPGRLRRAPPPCPPPPAPVLHPPAPPPAPIPHRTLP